MIAPRNRARPTKSRAILPVLPQDAALTGRPASLWATAILESLGAPVNGANVSSLIGWFHNEGGGGENNPMNTTLSGYGGTDLAGNSAGVKNYPTPQNGVAATASTLQHGYPAIVAQLQAGKGLGNTSGAVASELSTWSGGGYSSITPISPSGGVYGGALAPSTAGANRTRPGGQDAGQTGSGQAPSVLSAYRSLRDSPRKAPPGTKNPAAWWWASFSGNWDKLGSI